MTRTITAAALCVGLLAMPLSAGFAQTMSTPVDRVLRPGDTIQWVPADPHHLQLGSAGLTPLTEVDKILTFSPAPASEAGGVRTWSAAQAGLHVSAKAGGAGTVAGRSGDPRARCPVRLRIRLLRPTKPMRQSASS